MIRYIAAALVVLLILALIYPRTLSHDPATWHVDPLTAPKPSSPNSYRVGPAGSAAIDAEAPIFNGDIGEVGSALAALAASEPRLETVAGSEVEGFVTYAQRSLVFGFPDYISVRLIELDGGGSTIAIFSRARLGQSDFGVNQQRVERWLAELEAATAI